MAAVVPDPPAGEQAAPIAATPCRNCGAFASDAYCPRCGQETATTLPTARQFLKEAAGRYVAIDGRLWRTLAKLVLHPGFLTREYFAGRRRRYVRPARLFLVLSLLLFAVIRFAVGVPRIGDDVVLFDRDGDRAEAPGAKIEIGTKADERARSGPRVGVVVDNSRMQLPGLSLSLSLDDQDNVVVDGPGPLAQALRERLARFNALPRQERVEQAVLGMLRYGPYAMIVLLPAFAFVLMVVYAGRHARYPKRPRRYAEHLVYAAHNHAFFFLAVVLAVVVSWPALTGILWLWAFVYLLWSMKAVYGGPWLGVLGRAWLLAVAYFVLFLVVTIGLVLAAIVIR